MTEAEWLECTDPKKMLRFVWKQKRLIGTWRHRLLGWLRHTSISVSDRKLQMLVLAYSRRHLYLINDERDVKAIELAESYIEGRATEHELRKASAVCQTRESLFAGETPHPPLAYWVADACLNPLNVIGDPWDYQCSLAEFTVSMIVTVVAHAAAPAPKGSEQWLHEWKGICASEANALAIMLHDILGNPFRPLTIGPSLLTLYEGTVVKLAQAIYDDRSFDRLPILADALEDAGCDNVEILSHLRGPGPHVRGCWAVDLLLGKK